MRKKWKGGVRQMVSEREECEGVTGGATGGQRRGRMEDQKGGPGGRDRRAEERPRQNGQEGKVCSVKKEAKETLHLHLYVQSGQLANCVCAVCDGWSCA